MTGIPETEALRLIEAAIGDPDSYAPRNGQWGAPHDARAVLAALAEHGLIITSQGEPHRPLDIDFVLHPEDEFLIEWSGHVQLVKVGDIQHDSAGIATGIRIRSLTEAGLKAPTTEAGE